MTMLFCIAESEIKVIHAYIHINVKLYIAWDDLTHLIYLYNNHPSPIPAELFIIRPHVSAVNGYLMCITYAVAVTCGPLIPPAM